MATIIIHPTEDKIEVTCRINMNEKKKKITQPSGYVRARVHD